MQASKSAVYFYMSEPPFLKELGIELVSMAQGQAEIALNLRPDHMNSWQVMHGGVVMTLLDVCMARAARSLDPDSSGAATIEMKTSFFQPGGQASCRMQAKGRVLHRSKTLFYCEGEIWNGDQLVAKAMGTFKTIKRLSIASRMRPSTSTVA
jgi:uncharacterized protein (TIGR00369 family)